jgi:type I restriction enzyme S subunit
MSQEWNFGTIEDLCEVEYGTRVVRKNDAGTIYPVYGGGGATFSMDISNREDRMVIARFAMSEKCTRFVKGKFYLNDSGLTISPKSDIVFDISYLNYHILSLNDEIYSLARGTAQKNLNVDAFKKVQLSYPLSLVNQKQIVDKLDQAFAAIDTAKLNIEKNLLNAKELFQSKLYEIYTQKGEGWMEKRLGDICEYDKTSIQANDLPYVGLENIESNSGRFIGSLESKNVKSKTFYFDSKHILYGRLRPYLNKVLIPSFEGHCSTEIFPILVGDIIIREFLFYWFISSKTVKKIDETCTGARMPRANMNEVINFILPVPSIEKQKQIVKALDNLNEQTQSLESKYQQELNSLEELKKSILEKAFTGEL